MDRALSAGAAFAQKSHAGKAEAKISQADKRLRTMLMRYIALLLIENMAPAFMPACLLEQAKQ